MMICLTWDIQILDLFFFTGKILDLLKLSIFQNASLPPCLDPDCGLWETFWWQTLLSEFVFVTMTESMEAKVDCDDGVGKGNCEPFCFQSYILTNSMLYAHFSQEGVIQILDGFSAWNVTE